KDVLVKIKDLVFPVDFVIIDIEEDADVPITSRAVIDMEKEELTLRMGDKEQLIRINKGKRDWCCRIDMREKKEQTSQGWRMRVSLDELKEGLSQLKMEEEQLSPDLHKQMDMLDIKEENRAIWTKRWGKYRKVAVKSKFGVNKVEIKKPPRPNLKIKRVIDSTKQPEEVKWVNIPREIKVEENKKKSWIKGDSPREWDACYAFFKEQQQSDGWNDGMTEDHPKPTYPP
ncbi:hypothetical protein A2U01_0030465, partial [Trifolium medium]|nr:hypothetical protein [Trifolium medium]